MILLPIEHAGMEGSESISDNTWKLPPVLIQLGSCQSQHLQDQLTKLDQTKRQQSYLILLLLLDSFSSSLFVFQADKDDVHFRSLVMSVGPIWQFQSRWFWIKTFWIKTFWIETFWIETFWIETFWIRTKIVPIAPIKTNQIKTFYN